MNFFIFVSLCVSFGKHADKRNLPQCKFHLLLQGIFHNGLGMYAAWATIATLLNLGVVLTYEDEIGISQPISSSISLAALAIVVVAYIFLDHVVLEKCVLSTSKVMFNFNRMSTFSNQEIYAL